MEKTKNMNTDTNMDMTMIMDMDMSTDMITTDYPQTLMNFWNTSLEHGQDLEFTNCKNQLSLPLIMVS